jgi:hypothetical protein
LAGTGRVAMGASSLAALLLACAFGFSAVECSSDLCALPNNDFVCYKLHPSFLSDIEPDWPSGMPKGAAALSAVGVDPTAAGGSEVYVSQRGPESKFASDGPILVFNDNGDLLRQFGGAGYAGAIARNDSKASCPKTYKDCKPDGTFGGHGLSVKPDPGQGATQIWVDDFYECAVPSCTCVLLPSTPLTAGCPIQVRCQGFRSRRHATQHVRSERALW